MSDQPDLSDSLARLQALRERIRLAEEAAAREEGLRKQKQEAAMKLLTETSSIKEDVIKEKQALREAQEKANQLDIERDFLQEQIQNVVNRVTNLNEESGNKKADE